MVQFLETLTSREEHMESAERDDSLDMAVSSAQTLKSLVFEYERSLILKALEQTGGNKRRAAAILQILPTTLHEKMRRLGLFESPRAEGR